MSNGIFLIDKDGRLQQMGQEDYVSEEVFFYRVRIPEQDNAE